jgi:hypothetical protein
MDRGFVERQTAVARKRVQDGVTVIMQDMTIAENGGATTCNAKSMFFKRC